MDVGRRVLGYCFFIVLLAASTAFPASTCMRFLSIATLPRIAAIAEAGVAVTDATWAEANPAHIVHVEGSLITFSHTAWFEDISLETLTVGTSSGKHGFALSASGLHTEPLDGYDEEDRPRGTFRFFDFFIGASYARMLTPSLSVGVSGKTLYEKIDWDSVTGYAVDFGLGYAPPVGLLGGRVSTGFALRNLGPKMGYFDEDFDLPLTWEAGLSYRPGWLPESAGATAAFEYRKIRGKNERGGLLLGLEVDLVDMVSLRLGHRGPYDEGNLTFGVGLGLANTVIDYAYMDLGEELGSTHRISLSFKVGGLFPTPEESR
jgi:hypothetical protein